MLETLSVIAQVISYRGFRRRVLRMAPIHHHFEVGGWSEFTVTVRFWLFAGICVALAIGIFYADFLHICSDRVSSDARAVVIGLAETGIAVTRRLRAGGLGRHRRRGRSRRRARRTPSARPTCAALGAQSRRGADAPRPSPERVAAADLVVPSPLVRLDHPGARRGRAARACAVRSEIDLAGERATVPIVAVTGTNGKTTVTTLTAAMLERVGSRVRSRRATSAAR